MASYTYDEAISRVLAHEGGYTNHPADPGGPTNWGITIADARMYWKPDATAADVQAMPLSVAKGIYQRHYATPVRYNDLPAGLDYAVLDYGINSGTSRAVKVLRRLCGQPDASGVMTDALLAAVAQRNPVALINGLCDERLAFLQSLRTWRVFGKGWGRRVVEVRQAAKKMTTMPVTPTTRQAPSQPTPEVPMGKGSVPPHPITRHVGKIAVGGSVAAGGGAWQWLGAHPKASVALAVFVIVSVGIVAAWLHQIRLAKQEKPMPVTPVPAVKG